VSGAKFNIEKTKIIPIGTEAHRQRIITTRKINVLDNRPLEDNVTIAKDGDAVRILGAWIGNKVNNAAPWEPILDKMKAKIKRWLNMHPTLYGKRLIIQAIIGGHTQFLTKAQGMPTHIEDAIIKMIRTLIWDGEKAPRIAMETLQRPIKEGGLKILNIKARNEAIEIMWLKQYLNFTTNRPTWAAVTDIIITAAAPPGTSSVALTNCSLQSWKPPTRGPRTVTLGNDIARMLKTA